jgi:hypothetical protein
LVAELRDAPATSLVLSGEKARVLSWNGSVFKVPSKVPLVDQILSVASSLAEAMTRPSG